MFSVNTGIWTATFAVLEAILVCVVHRLHVCRRFCEPDTNTADACFFDEFALCAVWFSACLALLQRASRQPEC